MFSARSVPRAPQAHWAASRAAPPAAVTALSIAVLAPAAPRGGPPKDSGSEWHPSPPAPVREHSAGKQLWFRQVWIYSVALTSLELADAGMTGERARATQKRAPLGKFCWGFAEKHVERPHCGRHRPRAALRGRGAPDPLRGPPPPGSQVEDPSSVPRGRDATLATTLPADRGSASTQVSAWKEPPESNPAREFGL